MQNATIAAFCEIEAGIAVGHPSQTHRAKWPKKASSALFQDTMTKIGQNVWIGTGIASGELATLP